MIMEKNSEKTIFTEWLSYIYIYVCVCVWREKKRERERLREQEWGKRRITSIDR